MGRVLRPCSSPPSLRDQLSGCRYAGVRNRPRSSPEVMAALDGDRRSIGSHPRGVRRGKHHLFSSSDRIEVYCRWRAVVVRADRDGGSRRRPVSATVGLVDVGQGVDADPAAGPAGRWHRGWCCCSGASGAGAAVSRPVRGVSFTERTLLSITQLITQHPIASSSVGAENPDMAPDQGVLSWPTSVGAENGARP